MVVVGWGADASNSAGLFAELAVDLRASQGVTETVDMVVQFALNALDCSHAGVVFAERGGRAEVAAVTDPNLVRLYLAQVEAGDGPLITALTGQQPVLVRDTGSDARWPTWAATVRELGVASVLDVPMSISDRTVGVLGLYNSRVDGFDTDDEAVAQILARHAAVALATARHEEALAKAVDARKLIGQAMGILMERYHLDDDQAFAVLRRYSQDTNTKLHLIAQQLIDTRILPGQRHPTDPPGPHVRPG
jgi:GAF domain-containing protein